MKRLKLIGSIESFGCVLVPRHREIKEALARQIIRQLSNFIENESNAHESSDE